MIYVFTDNNTSFRKQDLAGRVPGRHYVGTPSTKWFCQVRRVGGNYVVGPYPVKHDYD